MGIYILVLLCIYTIICLLLLIENVISSGDGDSFLISLFVFIISAVGVIFQAIQLGDS